MKQLSTYSYRFRIYHQSLVFKHLDTTISFLYLQSLQLYISLSQLTSALPLHSFLFKSQHSQNEGCHCHLYHWLPGLRRYRRTSPPMGASTTGRLFREQPHRRRLNWSWRFHRKWAPWERQYRRPSTTTTTTSTTTSRMGPRMEYRH
jgi:hypothetical protein